MVVEQVQAEIFEPSHHKLKPSTQPKLDALLMKYESQFSQDDMSI